MPAFKNSFFGALPPTVGWSFFLAGSSHAGSEGPASTALSTSCLVGKDHGDCPTSSNFFTSSCLLFISPGIGGLCWCMCLCMGLHLGLYLGFGLALLPPTSRCDPSLCHAGVEKQPIRGLGRPFARCAPFSFTGQVTEFSDIELQMADEWSHISSILEREEEDSRQP